MKNQDIRWIQRFSNFEEAFKKMVDGRGSWFNTGAPYMNVPLRRNILINSAL